MFKKQGRQNYRNESSCQRLVAVDEAFKTSLASEISSFDRLPEQARGV
jgi:hypothetical protein